MLAVQSGKCGTLLFCCPFPWLLGEGIKIYIWTNKSLKVLLTFISQDNVYLFLIYFFFFLL